MQIPEDIEKILRTWGYGITIDYEPNRKVSVLTSICTTLKNRLVGFSEALDPNDEDDREQLDAFNGEIKVLENYLEIIREE